MANNALIREGETCWRSASARRVAVLVDGSSYFRAAREAILEARQSILIVGWDVHGETDLLPNDTVNRDDAPSRLRPLINYVVGRRPELRVRILLWDFVAFYAFEREFMPALTWRFRTPRQVELCLDDNLPLGGSHHQKLLVVDDAVAFSGGLDLTIRRWDTPTHEPDNAFRVDHEGERYRPYHDVQMLVDGEAARALAELARSRWRDATGHALGPATVESDPWPASVDTDFRDVSVAVARTAPEMFGAPAVREIEALYLAGIGAAERFLYLENQYLTSERIAVALIERLEANPRLEVLIIGPRAAKGFFEAASMGFGRRRFMDRIRASGVAENVRVLYPVRIQGERETPVFIHAKLMIVDDRMLLLGSANLNNRSMGLDTECNLAIEAASARERLGIAEVRNRLIAEHTGSATETVAQALASEGSNLAALRDLVADGHGLLPVEDGDVPSVEVVALGRYLADPDAPLEAAEPARGLSGAAELTISWKHRLWLTALALILLLAALTWKVGPFAGMADPDRLDLWLTALQASVWSPLLVLAIYAAAGIVMFPVTVLIVATAVAFGPWWGFIYALSGCLISAALLFEAGALIGRSGLRKLMGKRFNRISRALARQGILSVAIVRVLPLAPFTMINLVAGISHVRHRDYFIGTLLGMTPGLVIMSAMGGALRQAWNEPNIAGIAGIVAALGAWFAFGILVQRFVARRRRVGSDDD